MKFRNNWESYYGFRVFPLSINLPSKYESISPLHFSSTTFSQRNQIISSLYILKWFPDEVNDLNGKTHFSIPRGCYGIDVRLSTRVNRPPGCSTSEYF